MTRILVVDDSRTARLALRKLLEQVEGFEVVGVAADADEAEALACTHEPDLVTMDVHLGDADGVELAQRILNRVATRIVLVTGVDPSSQTLLFRALAAGALDVLAKPGGDDDEFAVPRFVRALRALATVPLRARRTYRPTALAPLPARAAADLASAPRPRLEACRRVLIGVSTGGPPLLERILRAAAGRLTVPVVVVQHVARGFGPGFARWLSSTTGVPTVYAAEGAVDLVPGSVVVAPDDGHLHLVTETRVRVGSARTPRIGTPSVDELYESALAHDPIHTLAILMTGMGSDGAAGLRALAGRGAYTIAQEPDSCVVGSMPRAAIELGAALDILGPDAIAEALVRAGTG